MDLRRLWLLALVLIWAGVVVCPAAQAPIREIEGLGRGSAQLDGKWQFHLGDAMQWAGVDVDDATGHDGWVQITADKPWGAQGHAGYTGFAWYRLHLAITPAAGAAPDFAMFLPPVNDVDEVYWNGVLVSHFGRMPPHAAWYMRPPPQTFGLGAIRTGVLAVRVWKAGLTSFDSGEQGGFSAPPVVGSPEAVGTIKDASDFQWLRRRQLRFGLHNLRLLIGLLALLAWLRDRRQWLLFWMACYASSVVGVDFLQVMRFPIHYVSALGWSQPVFGVANVSLWYILFLLLRLNESKTITRILWVLAIVELASFSLDGCIVFALMGNAGRSLPYLQGIDAVFTAIYTVLNFIPLALVLCAVFRRKHLPVAQWLVAICAFLEDLVPTLHDLFTQGSRYTHMQWIAARIDGPLFNIDGNSMTAAGLTELLLLIAIVYAIYRYMQDERQRQVGIEQEFRSARELQQVLIPEDLPAIPGFVLTTAYKPASEVGGDFFQIIPLASGSTLIVLGDVSGKGLRAAMAVSLIVGAIRTFAETTTSPSEILSGLDRRLFGRLQGGFATAVALRLDADGHGVLSSAGHPSPFLNDRELPQPGALPLGLGAAGSYEDSVLQLDVGEHLALYTDGLLEARNADGELYGFDRLKALFGTHPTAGQARDAAVAFGQDDDITVLTLTRLGVGEKSTVSHDAPKLVHA